MRVMVLPMVPIPPGGRFETNVTEGPVTFTFTTVDVTEDPLVSVTRAESAMTPEEEGVQRTE